MNQCHLYEGISQLGLSHNIWFAQNIQIVKFHKINKIDNHKLNNMKFILNKFIYHYMYRSELAVKYLGSCRVDIIRLLQWLWADSKIKSNMH